MSLFLLEDGSSHILEEDGVSRLLLEDGSTVTGTPAHAIALASTAELDPGRSFWSRFLPPFPPTRRSYVARQVEDAVDSGRVFFRSPLPTPLPQQLPFRPFVARGNELQPFSGSVFYATARPQAAPIIFVLSLADPDLAELLTPAGQYADPELASLIIFT